MFTSPTGIYLVLRVIFLSVSNVKVYVWPPTSIVTLPHFEEKTNEKNNFIIRQEIDLDFQSS